MSRFYRVTIEIEVHDSRALAVHAENIANRYDWPHPEEWAALRKEQGTVEADLQMILDPGESPPGTSILQSYVEAC